MDEFGRGQVWTEASFWTWTSLDVGEILDGGEFKRGRNWSPAVVDLATWASF